LKKAFSLIELMIVIVIMGVVYTLAITKLKTVGDDKLPPTLINIKEYLSKLNQDNQNMKLICFDDCSECSIYAGDEKIQTIDGLLDDTVMTYRYDFLLGSIEQKPEVFFSKNGVQENVCFSLNVDKRGISDQVIVVYKGKAYDYSTYFTKTEVYNSIDDAIDAKSMLIEEVLR